MCSASKPRPGSSKLTEYTFCVPVVGISPARYPNSAGFGEIGLEVVILPIRPRNLELGWHTTLSSTYFEPDHEFPPDTSYSDCHQSLSTSTCSIGITVTPNSSSFSLLMSSSPSIKSMGGAPSLVASLRASWVNLLVVKISPLSARQPLRLGSPGLRWDQHCLARFARNSTGKLMSPPSRIIPFPSPPSPDPVTVTSVKSDRARSFGTIFQMRFILRRMSSNAMIHPESHRLLHPRTADLIGFVL